MTFIEDVLSVEQPDATLVYGDVNSTLAGALASSKLRIPVAHIEAGVWSDARYNPEEINRRVTDVISDQLFTGTTSAQDNLLAEGYDPKRVHLVGDVLYDALRMVCEEHGITCRQGDYDVHGAPGGEYGRRDSHDRHRRCRMCLRTDDALSRELGCMTKP